MARRLNPAGDGADQPFREVTISAMDRPLHYRDRESLYYVVRVA